MQARRKFNSIHHGHFNICDHDIRLLRSKQTQRFCAVQRSRANLKAIGRPVNMLQQELKLQILVVHKQNAIHDAGPSTKSVRLS